MTGIQNDYRRLPDNEKTAAASLEAVTADPANLRHVPVRNWKSHATLTPLAKQDCPLWLQYD